MKSPLSPAIRELIDAVHYRPAISLIVPLSKSIPPLTLLKSVVTRAERELRAGYPPGSVDPVVQKLHRLTERVEIPESCRSVALFASPVHEQLVWLDVDTTEKIIIDESFEIRDLVFHEQHHGQSLLLLLTTEQLKLFHITGQQLHLLKEGTADVLEKDVPGRVGNFSDPSEHKEIQLDKFIHAADQLLHTVLPDYPYPLFVMAPDRVWGHFRTQSKHTDRISGFLPGHYAETPNARLLQLLQPLLQTYQAGKAQALLEQLRAAASTQKLATGLHDVWHEVMQKKGKLLVVERNYIAAAMHSGEPAEIDEAVSGNTMAALIRDAVDDIIEKVLVTGGQVVFVEDGTLAAFNRIALECFY